MAVRFPLVLNNDNIEELQPGDTLFLPPISLPVLTSSGVILEVPLIDGQFINITTRTGTVVNIQAQF